MGGFIILLYLHLGSVVECHGVGGTEFDADECGGVDGPEPVGVHSGPVGGAVGPLCAAAVAVEQGREPVLLLHEAADGALGGAQGQIPLAPHLCNFISY